MQYRSELLSKTPLGRGLIAGTIGLFICGPFIVIMMTLWRISEGHAPGLDVIPALLVAGPIMLFSLPLMAMGAMPLAGLSDRFLRHNRKQAWFVGAIYAAVVGVIPAALFDALQHNHDGNSLSFVGLLSFFAPVILAAGAAFGEWSFRAHQSKESIPLFEVFFPKEETTAESGQLSVTSEGELSLGDN